jgi:uncharacterized protein (DUF433 family)
MTNPNRREEDLLRRITVNPEIFGGKPILRGRRLAVEHVLGMLAAGDPPETILAGYPWLELEDIQACLVYARRVVGHERVEPALGGSAA